MRSATPTKRLYLLVALFLMQKQFFGENSYKSRQGYCQKCESSGKILNTGVYALTIYTGGNYEKVFFGI